MATLMLLGAAMCAQAQAGATAPATSDAYRRIEAIAAHFPARGLHLGQRPMSRAELRRILVALERAVNAASESHPRAAWARDELMVLRGQMHERDTTARWMARLSTAHELHASDAIAERVDSNGLGQVDASSFPFQERRASRPVTGGLAFTTTPTIAVGTRRAAVVVAQPVISLQGSQSGRDVVVARLHRAYVRAVWSNTAVQVGADEMMWGQSPRGALFISGQASPAPALVLSSDTAFTLPWLFRLAGPVRLIGVLADLGAAQNPPRAKLAGWHVSIQPWTRFELGVSVLAHTGGGGEIPRVSFIERFADLFPVIGAAFPSYNNPISNKLAGGNLRVRMPEWAGLDLYYELQLDDFDGRRLVSSFVDDAGHLLGARVQVSDVVFRSEWHRTSLRLYEHTQFKSGVTYRQRLIGSPLGPNARAGYLSAEWDVSPATHVDLTLADERRDPSLYTVTFTPPRDQEFTFVRMTDDPRVRRARAVATVERRIASGALRGSVGYNRAWRDGGAARHEWLAQIMLTSSVLPTF